MKITTLMSNQLNVVKCLTFLSKGDICIVSGFRRVGTYTDLVLIHLYIIPNQRRHLLAIYSDPHFAHNS